ncbi:unnamed protein product [Brassica rapa]|uniref:Uncharacterized protein n=1 Tax=Brassica campestris TaxID=3711 RepID=A0A8D9CSE7_BRACM|nr:unnamed protein product [Brassica rapa]
MGMGEPMLNLESVLLDAHRCLNEVIFAIYTFYMVHPNREKMYQVPSLIRWKQL